MTTFDLLVLAYSENKSSLLREIECFESFDEKTGYLMDKKDYLDSAERAYKHLLNLDRQKREHRMNHPNSHPESCGMS